MSIVGTAGLMPGMLFTLDGTDVWELRSIQESPTVLLVNLKTGREINHAVGCHFTEGFVPLIPMTQKIVDESKLPWPQGVRLDK